MKERDKVIFTFSLYAVLNIILFLLLFAFFPYIKNTKINPDTIKFLLAEAVNLVCNSVLMFGYGNKLIKNHKIPKLISYLTGFLFSSIFIICLASIFNKRGEKEKNIPPEDKILKE